MNPANQDPEPDPPVEVVEADPMKWENPGVIENRDDPPPEDLRHR